MLEGGVVKVGWWAHRQDPGDRGSQWPYLPPRFPLPHHLYMLKDATMGYVSVQTVCLSCGLISIGHGLSFMYFGRVLKGLLVLAPQSALHYPWSYLP